METQPEAASRIYDQFAPTYDASWHPAYLQRLIKHAPLHPGDKVLVPCCGTGLESFLAARIVGPQGLVVGVDISSGMLAEARSRKARETTTTTSNDGDGLGNRIHLIQHDVTSLSTSTDPTLQSLCGKFNILICSSAFVLFSCPLSVLTHWTTYLAPNGYMVIDITHERNMLPGSIIERVATSSSLNLSTPYPSNRAWIRDRSSFARLLEEAGMRVEKIGVLDKVEGKPVLEFGIEDADAQFDYVTEGAFAANFDWEGKEEEAREMFREMWKREANDDGRVEVVDKLYLYVARKL
ncbi:S-adenosyl-L-methionine-dependent methyltransferase [Nemania sp. FL0916]|nr:S-adenosyl-L-methionine-dependent methyltransferase [Nemania sp. FL0916]